MRSPRFLFIIAAISIVVFPFAAVPNCLAAESKPAGVDDTLNRVAAWDAEIARIDSEVKRIQDAILSLRRQASDADREWQKAAGGLERLETRKSDLLRSVEENRKMLDKSVESDLPQPNEPADKEQEMAKTIEQAEKIISDAVVELARIDAAIAPLVPHAVTAKEESEALHQQIRAVQEDVQRLSNSRFALTEQIETLLKDSNQWVSFKDQIAPIFHNRCVACHNVRNAQGRYNMATFDSMVAQSESGRALSPGQADQSLLVQMIEDGSMPYDADPLSEAEITLVRRWVDLGARIDVDADRNAPLIRLMPRVKQPEPPKAYSTPIPVTALAISEDRMILASSGYHEVLLWSLEGEGPATLKARIANVAQRVHGLAFHPSQNWLAVASGTPGQLGEVKLFDWYSGDAIADLLVSEDEMFDVAFSPDGQHLAACGAAGSIAIFSRDETENWRPLIIEDHADWVNAIAWSPDGTMLVSASRDKTSKVFDAQTGKLLITFNGHAQNVSAAVFTTDGKRVASVGDDKKARIWAIADAKQERDIEAARSEITGLENYGKNQIITFSADNLIRVHDLGDGKIGKTVDLPARWVSSLTLSPDQQTVFIGDQSGQIYQAQMTEPPMVGQTWTAVPD